MGVQKVFTVVICLQISIFELLKTTLCRGIGIAYYVVICLQISIFELLKTTGATETLSKLTL